MSKGGTSQTTQQQVIPAWLQKALQPLLSESAGNMLNFQRQGQAVLSGGDYKSVPTIDPKAPAYNYPRTGKFDPELMANYYTQRGGTT